jgi:hypothetical protein
LGDRILSSFSDRLKDAILTVRIVLLDDDRNRREPKIEKFTKKLSKKLSLSAMKPHLHAIRVHKLWS